ncbi:MAG: dihydrodipicolinate synthase family protein [Spirochaetales bacterium]|nr:dihydrodipicolinate synthase family protein [Spirochaetales bacterium]
MNQDKIIPYVACVTAYNEDESVNYDHTRLQYRRVIKHGGHIFCGGTNADFSGLMEDERVKIVEIAAEEAGANMIANAGCPSTYATIRLAEKFVKAGSPAVAVIAPYFIACPQEGLYAHYMRIADEVKCPVYIYNIPARTQNPVDPETVRKLSKHPNIHGIKDSSGDQIQLEGCLAVRDERPDFKVMSGSDAQILEGLKKGTSGYVAGLGNIVPEWVVGIGKAFCEGDMVKAEELQSKLASFRTELYKLGFAPAMVKRGLYVMDPLVGNNRSPALVPSPEMDEKISDLLLRYGIEYS